MNAGLIILCVVSERRDAQNERDGTLAAQLLRSRDSVAAIACNNNTLVLFPSNLPQFLFDKIHIDTYKYMIEHF